jgi:hypothetical protein
MTIQAGKQASVASTALLDKPFFLDYQKTTSSSNQLLPGSLWQRQSFKYLAEARVGIHATLPQCRATFNDTTFLPTQDQYPAGTSSMAA